MAELGDKIRNVLDEGRMLVLGAQVLLGFHYRAVLEEGFERLPIASQFLKLVALGSLLLAIALLLSPSSYQRLVERGEETEELHSYATRMMKWALLPFAFAIGIDLFVATELIIGRKWAVAGGVAGSIGAVFFWYVLGMYARRTRAVGGGGAKMTETLIMRDENEILAMPETGGASGEARTQAVDPVVAPRTATSLSDKIGHVLTEARVVLPGAQALLGFQFIAVLTSGFENLPALSKYVHLASLALIALTVILLMTPAAYHRIVERGEETEHFHRFATRMVVAALVPLALGLSGEVYVVVQKVTGSQLISVVSTLIGLALFWELWFGITLYRRTQRQYGG